MLGSTAGAVLPTLVGAMARGLTTSAAASAAAPAVATKSGGSLASLFGFGSARVDLPLTEALPMVAKPLKGTTPAAAPVLQSGSLSSGTKVVAVDSVSPVSAVSLVFEAGASVGPVGVSRVLENLAFKASANRTTFRITRELEKLGAVAGASVGRDTIAVNISGVRLNTPEIVELLLDTVWNPKLNYWEVKEAVGAAQLKLQEELDSPLNIVADVLHRAAYDGGLGQPLHADPALLTGITPATIREYLAATLHPSKAVLAAAGVGLDEFKALANPLVASSGPAPAAAPASTYVGGTLNVLAPTAPLSYVGVAIEAKGGAASTKTAATVAVLSVLLGDGSSLVPHAPKSGVTAYTSLSKSSGLVGVIAAGAPDQASALVDAAVAKVTGLAKPVGDAPFKAAKAAALGAYKAQLASAPGLVSVAAPALLATGKFSTADFASAIDSLSPADVAGFVSAGLKAGPTFASYGSQAGKVPRFPKL